MHQTQHHKAARRANAGLPVVFTALAVMAIGICLVAAQDDADRVPRRPDEKPRGRFQPSTAYVHRFSHAPVQVQARPKAVRQGRPMSPTAALAQLEEMRWARYRAEQARLAKETTYRAPVQAPPAPTPRFQLPGAGD